MGRRGIAAVARATGLAISTVTLGGNEVRLGAPRPSALPDEVIAGWVTDQAGQGIDGVVVVQVKAIGVP